MVILYISNCIHYHRNKERERHTHNVYIIGEYNQVAMHDSGEGRMQVYYPRHKRVCNIFASCLTKTQTLLPKLIPFYKYIYIFDGIASVNASAFQTAGHGFNSRVLLKTTWQHLNTKIIFLRTLQIFFINNFYKKHL